MLLKKKNLLGSITYKKKQLRKTTPVVINSILYKIPVKRNHSVTAKCDQASVPYVQHFTASAYRMGNVPQAVNRNARWSAPNATKAQWKVLTGVLPESAYMEISVPEYKQLRSFCV